MLDIDGVVNALGRGPVRGSWAVGGWVQTVVRADLPGHGPMVLPILAARPVLDFITDVYRSGAAEIRWHSTWRAVAMTDLGPALGLPPIPISIAPEWTDRPVGIWWKLPAAQRVVASRRPLIWTDDDLAVFADEIGGLGAGEDALLIAPNPESGLTSDDLARIRDFLRR